jgi:subfamily B ATP-binding cassette protein MsbA
MIRRLASFAAPHSRTLVIALALLLVATILEAAAIPMLLTTFLFAVIGAESLAARGFHLELFDHDFGQDLTRVVATENRTASLLAIAAIGLVIVFVKCACDARRLYLGHKFGLLVARDLRERLFAHLVTQASAFFETTRTGALLSRITADVVVVQQSLGPPLFEVIQTPIALAVALTVMLSLSWRLTLATLCLAPVIGWAISRGGRAVRAMTVARQDRLAALNGYLAERLSGIRLIQAFGRESVEQRQMAALNDAYHRGALRSVLIAEMMSPLSHLVAVAGMLAGLLMGGFAVFAHQMSPEHFILFFAVAPLATTHASRLARIGQMHEQVSGAVARLFELLDQVPEVRDAPGAATLPPGRGHVRFEGVSFHYRSGPVVLSDIDLEVAPGEVVAIVGPSGAGKSTLVNLIPRFFDATAGRVLVEGHDVRSVTLSSLRAQIAVVSQDATLFAQSVADNIRYGRMDATDGEVRDAARAANALEFIEALPDGFATVVGERGVTLSGGQRQRLAIARALLRGPRILILDEATSALDAESESLVQSAVERLISGRTTFVIAHRLSTIQRAHRIVVLSAGRIVESGARSVLLSGDGAYRRFHDLQIFGNLAAEVERVET